MEDWGPVAAGAVALALAWIAWRWLRRLRRLLVLGLVAAAGIAWAGGPQAAAGMLRGWLGNP
jgi:hypothetical protein